MSSWNLPQLLQERDVIKREFPTVTALNDPPTIYDGMLRCEKGPVKELANKGIWPFTEYVEWHRFRLELPKEFPNNKPIVTWLTDISHPNVVPNVRGAVCVSILGKDWNQNTTIVSVINSLYFLLTDPNPWDVYKHPRCLKSGEILRKYGFPRTRIIKKKDKEDIQYHDVAQPAITPPISEEIPTRPRIPKPSDIVRFTFPKRKKKKARPTGALFYCSKCKLKHFSNSRIGSKHAQYARMRVSRRRRTKGRRKR